MRGTIGGKKKGKDSGGQEREGARNEVKHDVKSRKKTHKVKSRNEVKMSNEKRPREE